MIKIILKEIIITKIVDVYKKNCNPIFYKSFLNKLLYFIYIYICIICSFDTKLSTDTLVFKLFLGTVSMKIFTAIIENIE